MTRLMNWLKEYAKDFPTLGAGALLGLSALGSMAIIVDVRLAFGKNFPDGYDTWILALLGLSGVTTIGMIGKRATDRELARIKTQGPPAVTVQDAAVVTASTAPVKPNPEVEGG